MCLMYAQRKGRRLAIANPKLMKLNPAITITPKASSVKPDPIIKQSCLVRCRIIFSSILFLLSVDFNIHAYDYFFFR